jgi:hypothetical protein
MEVDEFYSEKGWREPLEETPVVTGGDQEHAIKVLKEFIDAESEFTKYLRDEENWEIEGEDADGMPAKAKYIAMKCCGG